MRDSRKDAGLEQFRPQIEMHAVKIRYLTELHVVYIIIFCYTIKNNKTRIYPTTLGDIVLFVRFVTDLQEIANG